MKAQYGIVLIVFLLTSIAPAHAVHDVYIVSGTPPSPDGIWDTSSDPRIWTADSPNSQLYVEDILNQLATSNVQINTGVGGSQAGNIYINSPVFYSGVTPLSLSLIAANNINDNAAVTGSNLNLVFNPYDTATVDNDITIGNLGISQGTLILRSHATVAGATTVGSGSTLQVGSGSTAGTLTTGTVSNNGDLVFYRQGTLTIPGDMGGTGRLVQRGPGTTVVTGTPGCTGAITAERGTLAFTGAVPSSGTWNIEITDPSAFGNMTLPDSPDLSGKTIDVSVPALSGSYHLPLVSWAGTASGTPALRINGIPVASGEYAGTTALVYTPGTGVELFVSPACSSTVTIGPGDSIADGVAGTCDDGTLVLDAGTYTAYGIPVVKSITIRGHTAADTTIDGLQAGSSILTIAAGHTVVLDNLTLFNGTAATGGGAVNSAGTLVVNSSGFRNCTAANGGAIYSTGTIGGIASSAFTDNNVVSSGSSSAGGSAIWSNGTITAITSSTFSGGTAIGSGLYGAAIFNNGGIGTISSSTFSGGRTNGGGGAIYTSGTIGTISSSTFSDNLAQLGGAILNIGTIGSLSGSTFNGGLAIAGGAILNGGTITAITSTDFNGCRADSAGAGGAIDNRGSIALISSTTFTGCSCGNYGGAIYNNAGGMITSIVSSTFTGSEAREGGAIYSTGTAGSPSGVTLHFCRLVNNTGWDAGDAVFSGSYSTVLAENNWWGNNSPDFAALAEGSVSYSPWLVLNASAAPSSVTTIQTSTVLMKLTSNSAGDDTIFSGNVPDGIPVAYSLSGVTGSLAPEQGNLTIGTNSTIFDPSSAGTATITVTVDGESIAVPVVVSDVPTTVPTTPPTTAPTTIPTTLPTTPPTTVPTTVPVTATTTAVFATRSPDNDDGFPSVTPTASQADTLPLMTVTVNIGGDSKAWQAVVTGTGLRDLIVTGTIQPGSGSNVTAPPGTVFQYLSLVPARFTSITKAVLHFTVPQSWLDENHIAPKSVVLYHLTANGWEALPTTVLYTKDGTVYFSGESAGFSLFAIAGMPTVLTPPGIAATQEIVSTPAPREPPETIVKAPVTSRTTAPPAAAPQPAAPSPLLNIVLVIAAIGVLAGGGFLVRCWWIRRQNPTLFREYD